MHSRPVLLLITLCVTILAAVTAASLKQDFETDAVGAPPAASTLERTGSGQEGQWIVRTERNVDTQNHVLVQESTDKTDYRFPLAVLKDGLYTNVTLGVRARPLAGQVAQGLGL